MNLLPKSSKEFGSVDYWEKFFQQRGKKAFEWYGTYLELCGVLHKYIKPREKVSAARQPWCARAKVGAASQVALRRVDGDRCGAPHGAPGLLSRMKPASAHPQMEFPDASFQVVLDKGTLDAVLTDEEEKTLQQVDRMLAEVGRVLQVGGRYLCISLAQAHVLKKAVGHFSREGWMVRVHQVASGQDKVLEAELRFPLPVFAFIMTKFRPIPGSALQIFELCAQEQGKPMRLESAEQLAEAVRERQQYAWLCSQLSRKAGLGSVSLDLCNGDTGEPRYTLHVVDSPTVKPTRDNHFAIFIIPQGRETEWLFGMEDGRKQLALSAGFRRLITVALHRGQQYEGMDSIQAELSARVMELAPAGMPAQQQVPFLSVGGDIGVRTVRHQDRSSLSGDYVVEDVQGDDKRHFRRLIFLSNRNVVQSEARLLKDVCHRVSFYPAKTKPRLLLFPARPHYDVIMFDVDSKDPTLGMSCPPPAFVDQPFLHKVKSILSPEGVFILNLVCRDLGLKDSVLGGLKAVFPLLYVRRIEGEVNEILFCQLRPEQTRAMPELLEMAQALEQALRKPGRGWDDTYVLSDMLKTVKIV
ncbi:PREDICTED: methyltransferase-like protein 13 [Hipposideros armiger]|uniref:eEF1A lysine and N-terminal methyltransferase n=1 Tax=Hipposideros armiger TaxID=186990 RepID=A0A8B7RN51_HIPAR|nr:PREDICTED: methyltransferase-like protein 13 [Hipposideros armiger]